MNTGEKTGPDKKGSQDRKTECHHRQQGCPGPEAVALLGHHNRMQEGCTDKPGHEARILDGVPEPPAAPAEFIISPVRAEPDSEGQGDKGGHGPRTDAAGPDPVDPALHQACGRHRKDKGIADIAQIQHGRMRRESRILQERVQIGALKRRLIEPEKWGRGKKKIGQSPAGQQSLNTKGARLEVRSPGSHPLGPGRGEPRHDQTPQGHGPLMVPPGSGKLIQQGFQGVAVLCDKLDREVGSQKSIDEGQKRQAECRKQAEGQAARQPAIPPQPGIGEPEAQRQRQAGKKMPRLDHEAGAADKSLSSRG